MEFFQHIWSQALTTVHGAEEETRRRGELIRALGTAAVERVIEAQDELASLRSLASGCGDGTRS